MAASELSATSTILSEGKKLAKKSSMSSSDQQKSNSTAAYEQYLRLPELSKLWSCRDFPDWSDEPVVKPALQALEITFRFVSFALSDPRPYANLRERKRCLESLVAKQLELIAALCEDEHLEKGIPVAELSASEGVLSREHSSQEVWKLPGSSSDLVIRTSEVSLLPRLAAWERTEAVASKIMYQIESNMIGCQFSLGVGEPNLAGKPVLEYDRIVRPSELHAIKAKTVPEPKTGYRNRESDVLFAVHQILESWLYAANQLALRITGQIEAKLWDRAAGDCWILERVWKLLAEIEDMHLLMDPDDFLRLKSQLGLGDAAACFRSTSLLNLTNFCRDLKHVVPSILGAEAEAATGLYHSRRMVDAEEAGKVELLQAFQAVEAAVRRFFFAFRQLVATVTGSVEAGANKALFVPAEEMDELVQLFLEPPYFPSIDAAKTFLADYWVNEMAGAGTSDRDRR